MDENTILGIAISELVKSAAKTGFDAISSQVKRGLNFGLSDYQDYIDGLFQRTQKIRILAAPDQPRSVSDLYQNARLISSAQEYNDDIVIDRFIAGESCLIRGVAGSGKSMLVKYALHRILTQHKDRFPIFIELRSYNDKDIQFKNHIINTISEQMNNNGITWSQLIKIKPLLFLDGFDELNGDKRPKVIEFLDSALVAPQNVSVFLTSRDTNEIQGVDEVHAYKLSPFSLEEVTSLVSKISIYLENACNFINDLPGMYEKHKTFLSNPLLVNMMLISYEEKMDFPLKIEAFYDQAFDALFERHDLRKKGYKRQRYTSFDIVDMSIFFEIFCAKSYFDGLRDFNVGQLRDCVEFVNSKRDDLKQRANGIDAVVKDLTESTCLMQYDSGRYYFSHRSFQEYFCSKFLSKLDKDKLLSSCVYLEAKYWSDRVLDHALQIDRVSLEKYYIIPRIEKLLKGIEGARRPWLKALFDAYGTIVIHQGHSVGLRGGEYLNFIRLLSNNYSNVPFFDDLFDAVVDARGSLPALNESLPPRLKQGSGDKGVTVIKFAHYNEEILVSLGVDSIGNQLLNRLKILRDELISNVAKMDIKIDDLF
ncbi:NACHT domain-containing protein [Maricaulis parjimensis]|uniref:NACHT domain-containing protein n=1 Tax=Maricaulis parjimensis TaxID=144023 RepID=UPI00193A7046|nr:NACHT domain-containing protein [Maricaulis parjimensis]